MKILVLVVTLVWTVGHGQQDDFRPHQPDDPPGAAPLNCSDPDVFQCADGQKCIPLKWKCDFSPDCLDGSDEPADCPEATCQPKHFTCQESKKCIPLGWVCDNEPDCGSSHTGLLDQSDEDPVRCKGNVSCSGNQFKCKDGFTCLHLSKFCNHKVDCPDNSDEGPQCKQSPSCPKMSCSHACGITWQGPKCYCPVGLEPDEDNLTTCIDHDECKENGRCDQMCTNNNGSFVCNCQPGYKLLDDGHTCLAFNVPVGEPPSLIFANSVDIRHILFNGSAALSKSQSLVQTHETLALDFLHRNRTVCWISHGHGSGNRQQQKVATTSPSTSNMQCANIEALSSGWQMPMPDMYSFASVNQIAADWASHNWYFVDDTREIIQLCAHKEQGAAAAANNNKNVFMCKTILSVRLSKPRGIALDPNEGVMFFTIWGSDAAKLERASLDGNDRRVLVDSKIVYPYGLTVDFPMKRVYWVDTYLDYIEAVDYDGGNRKTILRGSPVQNLYSASVFENNLYVTSWRNNSIMRVNKFHPEDHVTVLNKLERPFAIQVFHRQRQPLYGNAVEGHDGRSHHPCVALHPCDHICLPIKDDPRYRCVCKSGYELSGSSKCVLARRSEFLLYGQQKPGVVRGLDLTTPKTEVIIPMIDLSRPTAMDYHAEANHLYLADSEKLRIERQSIQTGTKETFLSSGLNNIMGLAVDWVGRNLYWTDEGLQGIFVADVQDASKRALLISQDLTHPRSIVVDPVNGHMYWTNWPSGPPLEDTVSIMGKIERSWLDGSHREIFLAEDIVWPNGLSIDEEEKRIYWCDSYLQKIESMSLSNDGAEAGSSRKLHLSHEHNPVLSRPYGLTFHKKVIFWSEFEKGHIMRLDLETSNTSLIVEENPQLFSLKVFAQDRQPLQSHACEDPNTCQDLCLVTPNNGHVCKCRDGSQLLDDGKSCQEIPNWSPPSHCREHQFQCHRNLRCIDERYTCDGEDDCGDGSDEDISTTCKHVSCQPDQFLCDKTKCINDNFKCDGERDCVDGSDESPEECEIEFCSSNTKFLCKGSGKCIPKNWVCDSDPDCGHGDTSDEGPQCVYPSCQPIEYTCDNKRCIPLEYYCDGEEDCVDGSDERNCIKYCNDTEQFFCISDSKCLSPLKICNGEADCSDGSDELRCYNLPFVTSCRPEDEFQCSDSTCIPLKFKCDGTKDCLDGSDENCNRTTCQDNQWRCHDGQKCIPLAYKCDQDRDCDDGSDEFNCDSVQPMVCTYPSWPCDNNTFCISVDKLCDGLYDCSDRSDEGLRCSENVCSGIGNDCSDYCQNSPDGRRCHCPSEMHLNNSDSTLCTEDHPCDQWGTCSQLCKSVSRKKHKCYCHKDYYLEVDGFTCKSKDKTPAYAIYSTRNELRSVDVRSSIMRPLISSLKNTIALDFYHTRETEFIFWTDVVDDKIYRGTLIGGNSITDIQAIIENGLSTAEGLAVDWIGENLYWVESKLDQIEVAKLDGRHRRTLIADGIASPRAIAVDPLEGLLFWTDWDKNTPRIESCDMSGDPATRKVVFDVNSYKNGAWPNGLTLDYGAKRLYWIDARADSIHSAAYDGTDHREILRGSDYLSHPFAITLFESYIYWTDWRTTSIVKANKWNGSDIHIIDQVLSQPCDIRIVHPSRQPSIVDANDSKLNCKKNNGNCSHLCLIAQDGFRCACPHLMKLAPDGKSCIANNKVLLLSRPNEIRGLDLVSKDYVTPPLALKNTNYPMAIDFNSKSQQVYWMDPETPRIMRSFINGTRVETVIDRIIVSNAEHLSEAFAIDWITGNIYFATQVTEVLDDMSDHTSNIFVTSANVEFIQTIVHKNPKIIKGLVLAPTLGLMYWHDEGTTVESLNMANMDGSEPEEFYVFNKNVKPDIHCLTYSDETHQLFWINKHDNLIQKWDFKESRLTDVSPMLMTILTSLGSLTIDKSTLLFSETLENKSSIYRMELDSAVFLVANVSKEIYSLRVYDPELQQGSNPCLQDNGGCAHLCLPRGLNHRCICSIGFVLEDGSNCKEDNKDHVLYTSSFGISTLVGNEPMESRLFRPLLTSEDARSIEVYTHQQVLFWLDSKGSLFRMKRDGTEKKVIISGLQSPQRLAVDWVSERIYWTDDKVGVIELANFDGQQRYVVISGKMIKPFAIVLNPLDGILFWSDLDVPKIERAGLDGSNRMIIVTKDLKSPTGLAVDLKLRRLFWCDSEQSSLVSVNFDGGDRKSILESISSKWLSKPFGVAFFEGYLYWIDVTFNGGSVSKISTKTEGRHLPDLLEDNLVSSSGLYDIKIYSSRGQRGTNPCAINNGGCEEICLFNGQRTSCACSHGKIDSNDGKTCVEHDAFILYSKISRLESIHISNASDLNPPIKAIESDEHMRNTIGLAYNYESKLIFYSDIQKGTINQVNFNGENHKVLLSNLGAVEGLVFEHRHKYLYWTCNADTSISRISLNDQNTTNKKVKVEKVIRLQPDDKPRGIDVDSCDGKIYFTNWNAKNPSIQRAWFSGYGLETIISTKIRMPNAIAIDAQDRKMYWGDARLDKIELVYLNNMERIVLRKATPQHPFDLAVYDKYLMYTDWVLHAVVRVNKITGEEMTLLRKNIPRPMSLITVTNQSLECEANPCSVLNGGCEDICKVNRKGHAVCECHPGRFLIRQDGKRCSHTVQHCKDNHDFQCSQSLDQSPICIPYNLTCDGVSHCPDNSDEDERYCAVRRCKSGYFQCANNRCVVNEVKCNGKDNCGDFSDEDNCPCAQDDMFQCTKGPCIPGDQRCNSRPDCIDASDEIGCPKTDCSSFIDDEDKKEFVQDKEFVNCNHTTACILPEWICDGTNDCWDNSDEDHCHPDESLNAHTGDFCPVETTFKCDNGRCISISWRCDRENDCQDSVNGKLSSDEENCTFTCREDQFKCLSGDCIPGSWRCDGTPDCDDASDEPISCSSHSCIDNVEFRCNNSGRCIPLAWVCDGDNDCGDDLPGLDEHPDQQCQGQGHCKADEFRCLNNRCISNHFYCDLDNDCGDNSDEPVTCDYHFCPKDYFRCKNSHGCAPYAKLCDGSNDCLDGSDENRTVCDDLKFHKNAALLKSRCQAKDQFGCTNGACVPLSALCNGQDECGDYSDEASCNTNECENPHTCAHVCKDKPIGYECQCNHGFKIRQDDPSMCDDINECQETYPCAQMCLNTPGSYKCACLRGYIPADPNSHSCKANSTEEFKLLFTSRYYIKLANGLGITQTLVKNQTNTVAIDYDWISDCIFWSDVTSRGSSLRKMCNLTKNVSEPPKIEHLATLQNPDGLAVDWVGRNLYWCDKGSDTIEVSDLNGKHRKVLISQGLREPRAIAVDPQSGLLFWSDWGERPHIGRANMDGTGFKIIIETDLGWPNALAIDYATRELFFGDAREDYIAVSDMDGNNIRMILVRGLTPDAHLQHIFALTVFEDYIYWSDWETSTIERCHKYSGKRNKTVLTTIHRPMDLQVFHPLRQPMPLSNPCENNGGCDALCLLTPGDVVGRPNKVCQCPENFVLEDDGLSCRSNCSPSTILCENTLKCIPFWWKCDGQDDCGDSSDEPEDCKPFTCRPGQFQCENTHCIFPMQICDRNDDCGDGSDEKNCNEYTCYGKQFKCAGNGTVPGFCIPSDRRCNHNQDCPGGEDELDCPPKDCPINHYKCHNDKCIPNVWVCDGDNDCGDNTDEPDDCQSRTCPDTHFKCPGGRCIPMNWKCDGDPDCENNEDEPEDCQDTSVHECDATYFRCNNNRCIPGRWRCDHDDDCGDNSDETACLNLFRNCSESEKTCSDGMCIHEDKFCDGKQDCKDKTDELFCDLECSEDEFRCRSPPYCIFQRWKCDGDRDCSDGSDEKDCPKSECPLGEFTCVDSGSCIGTQWICDGEDDCGDNSDEASELCHQRSCEPGRYRCDNSQCILWSSVCDTVQDCSDGSDESAKACQTTGACNDPKSFRCANGKCIEKSFVCDDIDSCGDNSDEVDCDNPPCNFGACSQDCEVKHHSPKSQSVNTKRNITTASCSCVEGYALEAKKTCKALGTNATLLLANENTLRMIYPYAYHRMVDLHPEHAVARSKSPKIESVDVFYDDQVPIAVWSVKEERVIYYQKMGPGQQRSKRLAASTTGILVDDVDQPRGLAVDWLSMNLYFIDGLKKSIQLVKIEDTKMRKTIATSLDQPQDIAVDPQSGRLFFSDYGMNAKIYVANLDGSDLRSFIEAKVLWPSSLAIDYPNGRLYWTDLKARTIDSVALDGSLRKLVRKFHPKEGRPNKLDVFENFVYFSTYQHNKILKMNKFGRGNMTEIAEEITRVSDIVIMQENKAKVFKANMVDNPCKANGLCSHMPHSFCVLHPVHNDSAVTSKCICSDGFEDNSNGACIGSKRPEEAVVKGDCDDIDCNRGVCKIGSTDGKAKCDCIDPMYNGEFCDHYICAGYCFNGGMCFPNWIPADTSKPPQIMCSCRKGFEGKRCEIRTTTNNDCSTMCANNATCTIEVNGEAKCHCLPGFSGDRCDQCGSSQVCENGGQCRPDTNGIVRCSCAAGFHGPFCQFRQCDRYGPCQNEGSCIVSSLEGPKCECPPTFTGKFCDVYVCENYCKHGGTPTGRLLDGHYRCSCDCPPGISGERCEKDSCSTLQCFHGGTCHVLDGHELCNCTLDYTGIRCTAAILTNPCADVKCQNGGICQAVKSSEAKTQYHPKCVCSKHRAGLECERPNLCLDRCLNDGKCVSTLEGSVSCICPPGLAGTRCERKSRPQGPSSDDNRHVDTEEVNSTVITIMSIMLSIVAVIGLVGGLVYLYRKKRLGAAFKHRRMAENLVGNNMEFPNQMFLPEEDEAGGHNIPMSESTNFANPVYETMYGGGEAAASEANGGHHHQEEEGLLASDPDQIDAQSVNDHDSESVDLLTEKHRGNISL